MVSRKYGAMLGECKRPNTAPYGKTDYLIALVKYGLGTLKDKPHQSQGERVASEPVVIEIALPVSLVKGLSKVKEQN
jgi:hypothetical protein